ESTALAHESSHVCFWPFAKNGPRGVRGQFVQQLVTVETCAAAPCPVWSDWGPWEGCSLTCGQGQKRRSRKCLMLRGPKMVKLLAKMFDMCDGWRVVEQLKY
ncbi:thrombospondin type 1 domain protein, partial [Ancylostoma ceylanicum]